MAQLRVKVLGGSSEDFPLRNVVEALSLGSIPGEIIGVGVVGGPLTEGKDRKEKEKEKETKGRRSESCLKEAMEDFSADCTVGANIDVGAAGGPIKIILRVKKEDPDPSSWVNESIFEKIRRAIVDKPEIIVKSVDEMDNVVKSLEMMHSLFGPLHKVMKQLPSTETCTKTNHRTTGGNKKVERESGREAFDPYVHLEPVSHEDLVPAMGGYVFSPERPLRMDDAPDTLNFPPLLPSGLVALSRVPFETSRTSPGSFLRPSGALCGPVTIDGGESSDSKKEEQSREDRVASARDSLFKSVTSLSDDDAALLDVEDVIGLLEFRLEARKKQDKPSSEVTWPELKACLEDFSDSLRRQYQAPFFDKVNYTLVAKHVRHKGQNLESLTNKRLMPRLNGIIALGHYMSFMDQIGKPYGLLSGGRLKPVGNDGKTIVEYPSEEPYVFEIDVKDDVINIKAYTYRIRPVYLFSRNFEEISNQKFGIYDGCKKYAKSSVDYIICLQVGVFFYIGGKEENKNRLGNFAYSYIMPDGLSSHFTEVRERYAESCSWIPNKGDLDGYLKTGLVKMLKVDFETGRRMMTMEDEGSDAIVLNYAEKMEDITTALENERWI